MKHPIEFALGFAVLAANCLGAEAARWRLRRGQEEGPSDLAAELESWVTRPWHEWHEHEEWRCIIFFVVVIGLLVLMAAVLAVFEMVVRYYKNAQVQYLESLDEHERVLVEASGGGGPQRAAEEDGRHRVHGSESEDVWSFVDGDEARLRVLRELPGDLQGLKDRVLRAERALHVKSGPEAVEQICRGLQEIREQVNAPDFEQEVQENLHDAHAQTAAGCITAATEEQYGQGERHAHKEFKDARLLSSKARAYFASERWMDHMAIGFVFAYTELCGALYALYLHEIMEPEHATVLTPDVPPLEPRVLLARSQAMALIVATVLMVVLLTRGLCTRLRALVGWSTVLQSMIDKHVLIHKSCGYIVVFASFVHCLGHLLQTVVNIHNRVKLTYDFWGFPAVSGYLLWGVLIAFCAFSSEYVRRKSFEWFFYPHLVLIALWTSLLILHGGLQWFGFGVPLACISVLPVVLVYYLERFLHVRWGSDESIRIADAVVTEKMLMLTVDLGTSRLAYRTGQYSMLKVPEIARHEWHPFTIASGGGQRQLNLLIAPAGDWTEKLHGAIRAAQRQHEALPDARRPAGGPAYPRICFRGGYGAPAEGMVRKRHVVMVGGGVGCTPFLSFLSAACNAATMHENEIFPGLESAVFFWLSRNPEDFKWANRYSEIIAGNPDLAGRVKICLCLTKTLESSTTAEVSHADLSLFWLGAQRALRKQEDSRDLAAALGVPTQFGRPDWVREFAQISRRLQKTRVGSPERKRFEVSVFACGNPMLIKSLEKACAANTDGSVKMRLYAEEF